MILVLVIVFSLDIGSRFSYFSIFEEVWIMWFGMFVWFCVLRDFENMFEVFGVLVCMVFEMGDYLLLYLGKFCV